MALPKLFGWLTLLLVILVVISSSSLCAERFNAEYISKNHMLGGWYFGANLYSSLLGFCAEVVLPWSIAGIGLSRCGAVCLWLWCVVWDNACRLLWFLHERSARGDGHPPSRWPMVVWAVGNDINSLLLVPLVVSLLAWRSQRAQPLLEHAILDTTQSRSVCMFVGCILLASGLVTFEFFVFRVLDDVWWAHIVRLLACPLICLMARTFSTYNGCVYAYCVMLNIMADWTWATVRLLAASIFPGKDTRLLRALIFQGVFEMILRTVSRLLVNMQLTADRMLAFRFLFMAYNDYFLTVLMLQSTSPGFQFWCMLCLKLFRKSVVLHPSVHWIMRHALRRVCCGFRQAGRGNSRTAQEGGESGHTGVQIVQGEAESSSACSQRAAPPPERSLLPDKVLLLSHISSILCCITVTTTLLTDRFLGQGPRMNYQNNLEEVAELLMLLIIAEWMLLGVHIMLGRYWFLGAPAWSPGLDWWADFFPKHFLVGVVSFGLCVARSNERLLGRLASRSDAPQ